MEVVLMVRDFKASHSDVLLSCCRYFCRYQVGEVLAGAALLVLLVLLPIVAAMMA